MENFAKRLIVEHKEFTEKIKALYDFLSSDKSNKVSKRELLLLGAQFAVMDKYIEILEDRLAEHDVEAKNGLYKKIIAKEDIIEDDYKDQTPNPDGGVQSKK